MRLERLQRDLGATRRTTAIVLTLLTGSIAANAVLGVAVLRASGRERVVLVPPTVHKSFWVEQDRVSGEYLEQMAYFLLQLVLNVTPQSVEHQSRVLLQYASPAAHGDLRAQLVANGERLKRDGAATLFSPTDLSVDERALRVGVRGNLATFVSDRRVSDVVKGYAIEFHYTGGRIAVKAFRETHPNDPLDTRTPRAGAGG